MSYNTKQKEVIVSFFENNINNLYFAKDIVEKTNMGITTVYRILDNLVSQNKLSLFYGDFGRKYGFFPCSVEGHYHLICSKCGKIKHIDCDLFDEFNEHIINSHEFHLDNKEMFLKGKCEKCF